MMRWPPLLLVAACTSTPEGFATIECFNGVDDDGDGLVDCAAPSCKTKPGCIAAPATPNGTADSDTGLDGVSLTADAGLDQLDLLPGAYALLDGRGSKAADGTRLSYGWTLVQNPPGSRSQVFTPGEALAQLYVDLPGIYQVELQVTDGRTNATDTTSLRVLPGNVPPIAEPGPDQQILLGEIAELDGSRSSDPEGAALTYAWRIANRPAGTEAELSATDTAVVTLQPDAIGLWVAELVVSDGQATSPAAIQRISVVP